MPELPRPAFRRKDNGTVDPVAATDRWFLSHGLAYFVPEQRQGAREALRLRRTFPFLVLAFVVAGAAGATLAYLTRQVAAAPALLISAGLLAALWYALTALRARPIITWALTRGFAGLRTLLPMMSRALPLLLLFVTFLFINAEVWEMSASLRWGTMWLTCLLFVLLSVGFLLVRLPEEVDTVDDVVDAEFLRRGSRGTPLESSCRSLLEADEVDLVGYAQVRGYERANLVAVLVIIQAVQVFLLAMTVFFFFLIFGLLVMNVGTQENWTGLDPSQFSEHAQVFGAFSVPLIKVSLFLSAFSALHLAVSSVTDETYRNQFFGAVLREMQQAVALRAIYRAVRERREPQTDSPS
ncbi:hypothetical protein [Georgenia alba]|uniref:Integral membrane protein n=1 Tax=Georgenia alba TaxID=2233858 RepID=A0ABW2Q5S5_9MICO